MHLLELHAILSYAAFLFHCSALAANIPVRFNPSNYSVMEGEDSNAVITLEALEDHPDFAFTVTVVTQNGTAICEFMPSLRLCVLHQNVHTLL